MTGVDEHGPGPHLGDMTNNRVNKASTNETIKAKPKRVEGYVPLSDGVCLDTVRVSSLIMLQ